MLDIHRSGSVFKEVVFLKSWFVTFSGVRPSEAVKIWARWIISHISITSQQHYFLPTVNIENDVRIILELVNKGADKNHARKFYNVFVKLVQSICLSCDAAAGYSVQDQLEQDAGGLSSVTPDDAIRLFNAYTNPLDPLKMYALNHIYNVNFLYTLLDGKGLQWATPASVLRYLAVNFGCNTELFASPFNAYYPNYYSLFPQDALFGSKGNFFSAPDTDFSKGCYQLNPPFIDVIFTAASERILRLLDKATDELTFIYIMPEWEYMYSYDIIVASAYCRKVITLKPYAHFYIQKSTNTTIRVKFTTNIVILSTNPEVCAPYKAYKIENFFKRPYEAGHTML